jgi:hypothetical protein
MNFFDLLLQKDINQLRDEFRREQRLHDTATWDLRKVKELAEENAELKLRLALLVRLLIARGVFTAEEFATLIAQAHAGQEAIR